MCLKNPFQSTGLLVSLVKSKFTAQNFLLDLWTSFICWRSGIGVALLPACMLLVVASTCIKFFSVKKSAAQQCGEVPVLQAPGFHLPVLVCAMEAWCLCLVIKCPGVRILEIPAGKRFIQPPAMLEWQRFCTCTKAELSASCSFECLKLQQLQTSDALSGCCWTCVSHLFLRSHVKSWIRSFWSN